MDGVEDRLRELAPQVLGTLVRRYGQFDACEDAVQEALIDAAAAWPRTGLPDNPRAWLTTVAQRRLTDAWRSDAARRHREVAAATLDPGPAEASPVDDTLRLFKLCCHPDLPPRSQVALTLRAVGGLTTSEIAAAFLVPEKTMGQRITRAKERLRFATFDDAQGSDGAVLAVLYLIFNEGYTASSGSQLDRPDLTREAIRLARLLHQQHPNDGEVVGLLALMLLTDARRPARTGPTGELIALADQDRRLWNAEAIGEGRALIAAVLASSPPGPYQVQAAIAAVHSEAASVDGTDWPQIVGLYRVLRHLAPSPMVTLNLAVALAMVDGPDAGLALLSTVEEELAGHHRLDAVRAHLLERAGRSAEARAAYLRAAARTTSLPERRYLTARASRY